MRKVFDCEYLLRDAHSRVEGDMRIIVDDGEITDVMPFTKSRPGEDAENVHTLHGLTLPGLVDAHSHLRSIPAAKQTRLDVDSFEQWSYALTGLTPLPVYEDTLIAATELLQTGVTSVQIMMHSWGDTEQRLRELSDLIRAVEQVGLRALIILGFTDQSEYVPFPIPQSLTHLMDPPRQLLVEEWRTFVTRAVDQVSTCSDRITLGVGPVAPQWCSDTALSTIAANRGDLRVHAHLHESGLQRYWLQDLPTPLERLHEFGLLGGFASVAHGVDLHPDEIEVISNTRTVLVHCPSSNTALRVGNADTVGWNSAGVVSAVGLDSQVLPNADAFDEMRAAKTTAADRGNLLSDAKILEMSTRGGASALGIKVGEIESGALADFITISSPQMQAGMGAKHVVRATTLEQIVSVVIGGRQQLPFTQSEEEAVDVARAQVLQTLSNDAEARCKRIEDMHEDLQLLGALEGTTR